MWFRAKKNPNCGSIQYNISIGSRYVSQANETDPTPPSPPRIPTFDPKLILDGDEIDAFSALKHNYRLVPELIGRRDELDAVVAWARSSDPRPLVRVVHGDGGVGKTRLALEAALQLEKEDWTAFSRTMEPNTVLTPIKVPGSS